MSEESGIHPEKVVSQESTKKESSPADGEDAELLDIKGLDWTIERNLKNIEYQKFYLSLSSGALVFSITFVQKISTSSEYSWIIVAGWISLLISILFQLTSIRSFIGIADDIHSIQGWFKEGKLDRNKILQMFTPIDISQHYINQLLSADASLKILLKQFHNKEYEQMSKEELEEFRRRVIEDGELSEKVKKYLLKNPDRRVSQLSKSIFAFDNAGKRLRKQPLEELGKIGKALQATVIYEVVSLGSFYLGLLLISIYTIIRFLAKGAL